MEFRKNLLRSYNFCCKMTEISGHLGFFVLGLEVHISVAFFHINLKLVYVLDHAIDLML